MWMSLNLRGAQMTKSPVIAGTLHDINHDAFQACADMPGFIDGRVAVH